MLNFLSKHKTAMPDADSALPGRETPMAVPDTHFVLGTPLRGPFPQDTETAIFGAGCFWGVEKSFWNVQPGVFTTAVGYAAGLTPNPTYEEVCSARTGHNEVVLVVYRPSEISFADLLKRFWEAHDPTQGMRQGNDVGTQYRSAIYTTTDAQLAAAQASRERYQEALTAAGRGEISTEILRAPEFFYAEDYHQQYLAKNPRGYCGAGGTGVSCPIGTGAKA
ncbi:MAG: peptide-methionine (S)-S-oxide reductase [Solirubrobacteraceae bacterium]|nr:peptide-methionine (S)-S-oxide reductase [Solirubrobacteraceae bacterium]